MLFILTNSQDATVSFLIPALEKSGLPFVRFNTDEVLRNAAFEFHAGLPRVRLNGLWYEPGQISHIWYRRPEEFKHEAFDDSPEGKYARAEWAEFFENFFAHVPKERWMNHPSANAGASRKLEQLSIATKLGIKIPDTLVTQEPHELRAFYTKHGGRLIVKPLSTGYIERGKEEADSLIYTNLLRRSDMDRLEELSVCPTLFQEFVEKDYDVRITVVDSELTAVKLVAKEADGKQRCDIRRNNMVDVSYLEIDLPEQVASVIWKLMRNYCLRFAAIDMVVSGAGEWIFLEINPNGQWAWIDPEAGTDIAASFVRAFSVEVNDSVRLI
jgi:glutathione synthase/RimK-type ligase-like ATP-grasp enzyme